MTKLLILLLLGSINTADAGSRRTKAKQHHKAQRHHNVQHHNYDYKPYGVNIYWQAGRRYYRSAGLVWQWTPGHWDWFYWIPGHWVVVARF